MTDLQELRADLACALRWAVRYDLHEGVCNHFSVAVPDDDGVVRGNLFLINPCGLHWSEVTASSLLLCDKEGNVLEGTREVEPTAFGGLSRAANRRGVQALPRHRAEATETRLYTTGAREPH